MRDEIIQKFKSKQHTFRKLHRVVFLCGGAGSQRRDHIAAYLRKSRADTLVFYADHVWLHLAKTSMSLNALDMENELAQLADLVAIVVESPGTFAELGAFSLSDPLRKKLLPIIDKKYQKAESFINTGPVRWVDADSVFAPTIYAQFSVILDSMPEFEARIDRLPKATKERVADIATSPKHLLFLLCDLVAAIGPASLAQIRYYSQEILGGCSRLEHVLGLAVALQLVEAGSVAAGHDPASAMGPFYFPPRSTRLRPYTRKRFLNLAAERAKLLSVLQTISDAGPAIALMR